MCSLIKLFIIQITTYSCYGARILLISPSKSYSHQTYLQPILFELLNRGHEVVYLTPQPINDPTQRNLIEINLEPEKLPISNQRQLDIYNENQFNFLKYLKDDAEPYIENAFRNPCLQDLIHNSTKYHFDIVVMEWLIVAFVAFSEIFNCPVIGMLSVANSYFLDRDMGVPMSMLQSFDSLYPLSHPTKSFSERFFKLVTHIQYSIIRGQFYEWEKDLAEKYFGIKRSDYGRIKKKMNVIFVNQHPGLTGSVIQSLGAVNIGGMFYKQVKPLPMNLQDFLDSATEGVIYFSLGTNVQPGSVRQETLQIFIEALKDLPYKILWKWDSDSYFQKYGNILVQKWFPQSDVLRHRNIKCFITQAGLQSLEESIHAQVPVVAIPFFSDQHYFAHRIQLLKIGIQQRPLALNKEEFRNAVLTVITDPIYKENMIKLSNLYQDQMISPLDKAIWWIEHTIRHNGNEYMKNPLLEYSLIEFYMLDIFATIFVFSIVIIYIILYAMKLIFTLYKNKFKQKFD